jgi:hypothetical protein
LRQRDDGCAGSVIAASIPITGIVKVAGYRRLSSGAYRSDLEHTAV